MTSNVKNLQGFDLLEFTGYFHNYLRNHNKLPMRFFKSIYIPTLFFMSLFTIACNNSDSKLSEHDTTSSAPAVDNTVIKAAEVDSTTIIESIDSVSAEG